MTTALTQAAVHRRFLVLTALRWLPVGLLIPILLLLPLERGLSLSEVGVAVSLQGFVVLALELPTGGLADALGRRRVLLIAGVVGIASVSLVLLAQDLVAFATAYALQGVYRALDSGPLEAWYVDASLEADPDASLVRGLSGAGVVLGTAISAGALASGGLIAMGDVGGVDALSIPVLVALAIQLTALAGVAGLMVEHRESAGLRAAVRAAATAPTMVAEGLRLLRRSPALLGIVAVELFWGFGAMTYESLLPVRLTEIVDDPDRAAVITGPATSAAFLASAAGAALMPWLGRRLGIAPVAALMRILHGATVLLMGMLTGVVGVVTTYLACYAVHGISNPAHMTLLHRQVEGRLRTTVISVNSMMAQPAGAVGVIVLTAIADGTSASMAMYVGAAILAVAAPLYVPAWRQERRRDVELVSSVPAASGRA